MQTSSSVGHLDHRLADFLFTEAVVERRLAYVLNRGWATTELRLPDDIPGTTIFRRTGEMDGTAVVVLEAGAAADALAQIEVNGGQAHVEVAAPDQERAAAALDVLRELLPEAGPHEGLVPITFWSYGRNGSQSTSRMIDVPPWDDVEGNYAAPVRARLDRMMGGFRPAFGGQLVLWHGPPGTGKTWALRALAWEWRGWAQFHYIVDPDKFFGAHADYLLDVLLHGSADDVVGGDDDERGKWRILLLEDTGEMLSADARERTGQGLSRLLNVVDGLIGQGLKVLALVTTNEEIKKLHPAISRPGRCAALINFSPLSEQEVHEWLVNHDHDPGAFAPRAMTLADLYAAVNDYERVELSAVGFG